MKTDFLVIGSGISGLNYSLKAAEYGDVTIVTKKKVMESNTNYAQGGIAAALDPLDSCDQHIRDTLTTGDGLCKKEVVELVVKEAPRKIKDLIKLGVKFNKEEENLSLAREGGHSTRRIVFVGDATGHAVEQAFVSNVKTRSNIEILEGYFALDLILKNGRCNGAHCLNIYDQEFEPVFAKGTVLATGGLGQIYEKTSNPEIATGDGVAMAYKAGAEIADIEFIQFHPTILDKEGPEPFLISEVVRGEGGVLRNSDRLPFMEKYHNMRDLAPRDIVTRAIIAELENGPVFLDLTAQKKQFLENRFPTIYNRLLEYGISMHKDLIPIIPAAHYACGGVNTDINGRTNIEGLYAIGEVSCTGLHGANRLASNSLLGCLVFSLRAAEASAKEAKRRRINAQKMPELKLSDTGEQEEALKKRLRSLTWKKIGVIRNNETLQEAIRELREIDKIGNRLTRDGLNEQRIELRNMTIVSELIAKAALIRTESRGTHYRTDYPRRDDINWRRSVKITSEPLNSRRYF
jgi:L-aspartate oxidase